MQTWQVGLDVQDNGFYAIAVQKKRYGWQLRHWHFQPIYSERLQTKIPVILPEIIQLLREWRKQLPKRVSFRIALPASSILQQLIPLPEQKLSQQEQSWLVDASLSKLFPLSAKELAIDYRVINSAAQEGGTKSIVVSAARRTEVDEWIKALAEADIFPDVIDTWPCVLRSIAEKAEIARDHLLFHQFSQQFLFVSPLEKPFFYRLVSNEAMRGVQRLESALDIYEQISGEKVSRICYSGLNNKEDLPDNTDYWSPLVALQQLSAPLPDLPHQFVLACGLALRQEDHHASG